MKKLIILLALAFVVCICASAIAEDKTQTLTFAWEQDDVTNLTGWEMHWGDAAGGPYVKLADLPYNPGDPAGTFQTPVTATVTGGQGSNVIKYFVLRACGDIPQEGGGTAFECSDWSNEVSYSFWIPAGKFSVPVQFRIEAQ
jgi:hypothetical protein